MCKVAEMNLYSAKNGAIYLSIDTAPPSLLSIMRRDACVRIKGKKKKKKNVVRAKRAIVKNEKR